jgi:hypothetical protein
MECVVCGSKKAHKKFSERIIKAAYGSNEIIKEVIIACDECKEEIDHTGDSETIRAWQQSEKNGLVNMLKSLEEKGFKPGALDMFFGLPYGTIQNNIDSSDPVNPALYSLLVFVCNVPEMLEHGDIFSREITFAERLANESGKHPST